MLFPLVERAFTYDRYGAFLDRLAAAEVVPLREFAAGRGTIGLRHDVDDRLESALEMAELERARGVRSTYFVLHTAPYWREPTLIGRIARLQELGHEIGFHNDLVTAQKLHGLGAAAYLRAELERLRAAGIEIVGAAAHGSPWCHKLGYHNNYVFEGWDEPLPGFPNRDVPEKLRPSDFGLEYEAYHLGEDAYFSDARFETGRRWHPDALELEPGARAIVLVHPCHWDASVRAKVARLGRRLARKLTRR